MGSGQQKTEGTKGTQGTKGTKGKVERLPSFKSFWSFSSLSEARTSPGFLPLHGGYQKLLSYQKAEIVYDATVYFCNRFFNRRDRTHDQMVQAARSGKQNIVEGSQASGTSKETEIKLTSVARASLEELLTDYRDFLRNRGLVEWTLDPPYVLRLRALNRRPGANYATFRKGIEHPDPSICVNVIIGLIKVTCYLLDRQLRRLEQEFLREGGLRERMTRARLAARAQPRALH
jgi:four helix bundle suffix protein